MIFFGSKGKVVAGEVMQGVQCPSCQHSEHASFGIMNYFHLYWIPTFLTSKKAGMECTHCKHTLVGDELPSHLAEQIKEGVFTTGKTLPMFSGLIIICALIMMGAYAAQQDNAREATYAAQPAVNDYYVVKLTEIFEEVDAEYPYGLMRITDVSSTGIEMQVANVAYNKASGVKSDIRQGKASADTFYGRETLVFELADLQHLNNSGAVYSIER